MLSYAAAVEAILAAITPLPVRTAAPRAGDVAAGVVDSRVDVPSFANAAMDGFALRSAECAGANSARPVRLAIAGTVAAGQPPPAPTPPGAAWEIMTGAPMPPDCDAVVPLERIARPDGEPGAILVDEPPRPGQNRRAAGEDFARGDRLLDPGTALTPQAVMALAAVGVDGIEARPPPRIGIVTTGSELAASGLPDAQGRIRDTNGPYLEAALAALGLPLAGRRSVADDGAAFAAAFAALAPACDILITTGGVSAGRLDFVPAALAALGAELVFHKVAIRPGKPLLCARLPGGPLVFGLPGNPMAVAVGLRFFVLPAVHALQGRARERLLPARTRDAVRARPTMTFFGKAHAEVTREATLAVHLLPGQESFRISPLLRANCWMVIPAGERDVAVGDLVEVAPMWPGVFPGVGE